MATNYDIDYNDKRFTEVEADKKAALSEADVTYGNMISSSDQYYQEQINASKDYAETQKKNQQAQTDFAIEQIEQQKDQAHSDYIKEQSGAYVDWQKQSNPYGVEAEKRATAGLAGTGYSESSLVSMYNTYQNRVATARESYNRAVLNYDNAIKDARLQNNAQLAEIAYNALQQQLQLSLQGFQYKNQLLLEKAEVKRGIESTYYARYQDVINQINTENALAEEKRQADLANARQMEQIKLAREQFEYEKKQAEEAQAIAKKAAQNSSAAKKAVTGTAAAAKAVTTALKNYKTSSSKTYTTSTTGTTRGSTTVPIDMASVTALGLGPISAAKLDELVASGRVISYVEDGKRKFKAAYVSNSVMNKSLSSAVKKNKFGK